MHTIYSVEWTERGGRTARFHYLNRNQAERVAVQLRRGWRKDARVVACTEHPDHSVTVNA